MRIIDNTVICIRSTSDQHDYFEQQSGIKEFPKREMFTMIPEDLFTSFNEPRIIPELRGKNLKSVARWTTHTAIIETFLKNTNKEWLFVIEDVVEFSEHHIKLIESLVKPGFNKLETNAAAYIIDRETATQITKNAQIYYAPFESYINDLSTLGLIQIHNNQLLKVQSYPFLYNYFPLLFIVFCIILYIGPLYRICAEYLVRFTKMFGAKETPISG
jgi:hypothetical protein